MRIERHSRARLLSTAALTLAFAASGGGAGETATAAATGPIEDACRLVTQQDAEALFGKPASPEEGISGVGLEARCLWTWDTATSNQLLQLHIWSAVGLDPPDDAERRHHGDGGYVRANVVLVDVNWLQGGKLLSLSHSRVGPDVPKPPERRDQVVKLAREVAKRC